MLLCAPLALINWVHKDFFTLGKFLLHLNISNPDIYYLLITVKARDQDIVTDIQQKIRQKCLENSPFVPTHTSD